MRKKLPMRYPTHLEYAILSHLAYYDDDMQPTSSNNNTQQSADVQEQKIWSSLNDAGEVMTRRTFINAGWEFYKCLKDDNSSYHAVVYINHHIKQIVVAHRGTVTALFDKPVVVIDTIKADAEGIVFNKLVRQQREARNQIITLLQELRGQYNNAIAEIIKDQDYSYQPTLSQYQLSFTGHSLGALLAEVCAAHFQVPAVTFESPGSFRMIAKLYKSNIESPWNPSLQTLPILTYLTAPNLVNTCNKHVGEVRRVYPEKVCSESSCLGKLVQDITSTLIDPKLLNRWLAYTLSQHDLIDIIKIFDPTTGLPKQQRVVLKWPHIDWLNLANSTGEAAFTMALKSTIGFGTFLQLMALLINSTGILKQYLTFHQNTDETENFEPGSKVPLALDQQSLDQHYILEYKGHYQTKSFDSSECSLLYFHPIARKCLKLAIKSQAKRAVLNFIGNDPGKVIKIIDGLLNCSLVSNQQGTAEAVRVKSAANNNNNNIETALQLRDRFTSSLANDPNLINDFFDLKKKLYEGIAQTLQRLSDQQNNVSTPVAFEDNEKIISDGKITLKQRTARIPVIQRIFQQESGEYIDFLLQSKKSNSTSIQESEILQVKDLIIQKSEAKKKRGEKADTNNNEKLLILGSAGSGKTTLCKHIVQSWATGEMWASGFEWVFWLPLRRLNYFNEQEIDRMGLKGIIRQEYFPNIIESEYNIIWTAINIQPVLYLIDGYDEAPGIGNRILESPEFVYSNATVIVTSRPILATRQQFTKTYKLLGFSSENIRAYVQNPRNFKGDSKAFLNLLYCNNHIAEMAQIPINLEIMCHIFENSSKAIDDYKTMESLYAKMVQGLVKLNSLKHNDASLEKFTLELECLEKLAFATLAQHEIVFSEKYLELANNHPVSVQNKAEQRKMDRLERIKESGFIQKAFDGNSLSGQHYSFVDLTIQEYFAARYISDKLIKGETEYRDFIKTNKYHPMFAIVWPFVAGILSKKDPEKLLEFLQILEGRPRDLVGFRHMLLMMRCIDECITGNALNVSQSTRENLETVFHNFLTELCQWIEDLLLQDDGEFVLQAGREHFINSLKLSQNLLHHPQVVSSIQKWINSPLLQINAVKLIGELELAVTDRGLIACLFNLLERYPDESKKAFVLQALSCVIELSDDDKNNYIAKAGEFLQSGNNPFNSYMDNAVKLRILTSLKRFVRYFCFGDSSAACRTNFINKFVQALTTLTEKDDFAEVRLVSLEILFELLSPNEMASLCNKILRKESDQNVKILLSQIQRTLPKQDTLDVNALMDRMRNMQLAETVPINQQQQMIQPLSANFIRQWELQGETGIQTLIDTILDQNKSEHVRGVCKSILSTLSDDRKVAIQVVDNFSINNDNPDLQIMLLDILSPYFFQKRFVAEIHRKFIEVLAESRHPEVVKELLRRYGESFSEKPELLEQPEVLRLLQLILSKDKFEQFCKQYEMEVQSILVKAELSEYLPSIEYTKLKLAQWRIILKNTKLEMLFKVLEGIDEKDVKNYLFFILSKIASEASFIVIERSAYDATSADLIYLDSQSQLGVRKISISTNKIERYIKIGAELYKSKNYFLKNTIEHENLAVTESENIVDTTSTKEKNYSSDDTKALVPLSNASASPSLPLNQLSNNPQRELIDGWSLGLEEEQQNWLLQLESLFVADSAKTTDINDVKVSCVSFTNQSEVKTYCLDQAVYDQLFENNKLKPKPSKQPGRHTVLMATHKGKDFCFRFLPEQPGTEYAINLLARLIGDHHGTLMTAVIKLQRKTNSKHGLPVEIMPQVHGERLDIVFKEKHTLLDKINSVSYTQLLLRTLIVNPEDDKEDDYFLVPIVNSDEYRLLRVDNERGFYQPTGEIKGYFKNSKFLQVKSVVYCLDQMQQPLNWSVLEKFLTLQPMQVLKRWLTDLEKINGQYRNLFTNEDIEYYFNFKEQGEEPEFKLPIQGPCLVGVPIAETLVADLMIRLELMQLAIRQKYNQLITGMDLLKIVQSELATYYENQFKVFPFGQHSVLDRFNAVTAGQYIITKESQHKETIVTSKYAISQPFGNTDVPLQKIINAINGKENSPSRALMYLEKAYKNVQHVEDIKQNLLQMTKDSLTNFKTLPLQHQQQLFNEFIKQHQQTALSQAQLAHILQAVASTVWLELNLMVFKDVLSEIMLDSILKKTGQYLLELNLSECHQLSDVTLCELGSRCPNLKRLLVNDIYNNAQRSWLFATTFTALNGNFLNLIELEVRNCKELVNININAPKLKNLIASKNGKLQEIKTGSLELVVVNLDDCIQLEERKISQLGKFYENLRVISAKNTSLQYNDSAQGNSQTSSSATSPVGFFSGNPLSNTQVQIENKLNNNLRLNLIQLPDSTQMHELEILNNGNCFYISLVIGMLMPIVDQPALFKKYCSKLFGDSFSLDDQKKLLNLLKDQYDGSEALIRNNPEIDQYVNVFLRPKLASWVKSNKADLLPFVEDNEDKFSKELKNIEKPNEWADNFIVGTVKKIFKDRGIYLYQKTQQGLQEVHPYDVKQVPLDATPVYLCYAPYQGNIGNNHYRVLIDLMKLPKECYLKKILNEQISMNNQQVKLNFI